MIIPQASPETARKFFQNKIDFTTGPVEAHRMLTDNRDEINLVDVRTPQDYAVEHVPTAVNLPRDQWSTLQGLQKDKLNILYCYSTVCHLAANAAVVFASHGYRVMEMDGGMKEWKIHKLPVESEKSSQQERAASKKAG